MAKQCSGCSSTITDGFFMECSNDKCRRGYDLQCLKISLDAFKKFTLAYKKKWVCPECVCLNPKRGNLDTPVRADPTRLRKTTTPDNVNTQRGSQAAQFSPTILGDGESLLLEELRQFRLDMMTRMDYQANAIMLMQDQFAQTKKDLDKLVNMMTVIEEKVNLKLVQNTQTQATSTIAPPTKEASMNSRASFAEAVGKNKPSKSLKNTSYQPTAKKQNVNLRDGATKTTGIEARGSNSPQDAMEQMQHDAETGWMTVQYKKPNRLPNNVTKGSNTEIRGISAMERKKYLHVWRLHPDTTLETMTEYVKNLCGSEAPMIVEKIKHRTVRDYSSFLIGVSEKHYTILNNAEVWPLNTEFSEWIWFRKQPSSPFHKS